MSERASLKKARAKLGEALSLLQGEGAPTQLRPAAKQVAQCMGLLHELERTAEPVGAANANAIVNAMREALSALQSNPSAHPSKEQAASRVAAALGTLHTLIDAAAPNPMSQGRKARAAIGEQTLSLLGKPEKPAPKAAPGSTAMLGSPHSGQALAAAARELKPRSQRAQPSAGAQTSAALLARPGVQTHPVAPAANGVFPAEASLGAHSSSNFYKGLGGSDVIEAGGIFVATYRIPAIGQPVALRVHLPGGYEFDARGVVAWTRESAVSSSGALGAPPGFGARLTEISSEGRALVARYVGQREPLFHDDP